MQARPTTEARSVGHHAPLHAPSEGTGVPSHFTMLLAKGIALRRVDDSAGKEARDERFGRIAVGVLASVAVCGGPHLESATNTRIKRCVRPPLPTLYDALCFSLVDRSASGSEIWPGGSGGIP